MNNLDRYLRHRRRWEALIFVSAYLLQATLNSITVTLELRRANSPLSWWEAPLWEFSSNLVLLALVPLVLAAYRRWPLRGGRWRVRVAIHVGVSVLYSVLHVVGMVLLRKLGYALGDQHYDFGRWPREFAYEYLKDARSYVLVIALAQLYGYVLLRLQGEARLLTAPDEGQPVEPVDRPERFLVRKLRREFLVLARDIEWAEAAGNYVNLHVRGHHYPLRSTMNALEPRLDPTRFVRVHRGFIVNLDHLQQIEPLPSGDARLRLQDGTAIPCSRRFRDRLKTQSPTA